MPQNFVVSTRRLDDPRAGSVSVGDGHSHFVSTPAAATKAAIAGRRQNIKNIQPRKTERSVTRATWRHLATRALAASRGPRVRRGTRRVAEPPECPAERCNLGERNQTKPRAVTVCLIRCKFLVCAGMDLALVATGPRSAQHARTLCVAELRSS